MNKYRVTTYLPGNTKLWEGEAINSTDALLYARQAAEPARWEAWVNRPNSSQLAPPWRLFSREDAVTVDFAKIQCKVERIG